MKQLPTPTSIVTSTLPLGLEGADEDELYQAMDWLLEQQERIGKNLAAQHLTNGSLVLIEKSRARTGGRTWEV